MTPPQLVASVPSISDSGLSEPAVEPITEAPAAALARLTSRVVDPHRLVGRAGPTVSVNRWKPWSGET